MSKRLFSLLFGLLLSVLSLSAQTFYVNGTTGSDANSSTQAQNQATPWATIQHAIDNAVPGCEIVVMDGTYLEELSMSASGTAAQPITLRAENCGAATVSGNAQAATLLWVENVQFWIIECLVFANATGNNATGIEITGTSAHITLRDCEITGIRWNALASTVPTAADNAYPLIVYGNTSTAITDITVEGCSLYDNVTGFSETCAFNGNVDGFVVTNCKVSANTNIGIDAIGNEGTCPSPSLDKARNGRIAFNQVYDNHSVYDSSAAGIYCDGAVSIIVEGNDCHDNDYGIEIGCEAPGMIASDFAVRNNLIQHNRKAGLVIGGYDGPVNTGTVKTVTVTGNTFYQNDALGQGNGEMTVNYTENASVHSNIFNSRGGVMVTQQCSDNPQAVTFDYNRWFSGIGDSTTATWDWLGNTYTGFGAYRTASGLDSHSSFGAPGFVSAAPVVPADFQIAGSSPCLDAGDPAFTAVGQTDFFGGQRLWGCCVDMGFHEKGTPGAADPAAMNELKPVEVQFTAEQTFVLIPGTHVHVIQVDLFSAEGKSIGLIQQGGEWKPASPITGMGILRVITTRGTQVNKYFFNR